MPQRSAQDFVDEAREADPWELKLASGKVIRPKARAHFSHDEELGELRVNAAWAEWFSKNPTTEPSSDPADENYRQSPFDYDLATRLGDDRDDFWAEFGPKPKYQLQALFRDLDTYYDPTPATPAETAEAEADPAGDAAGK